MSTDLFLVTIAKALVEIAALFILGQGILYVLSGDKREGNFFYQLLRIITQPVYGIVRLLTPKVIVDRHVPWVALMVLFWLWLALTFAKIQICAGATPMPARRGATTSPPAPFIFRAGDAPVAPL